MLFATAGTTFHIGNPRPSWSAGYVDASAFAGEAWTEVGGVSSLGRVSGEWETQSTVIPDWADPDAPPMQTHDKTVRPTRTMQIVAGGMFDDPGQLAMLQAEDGVDPYSFRLVLPNGAQRLFIALVTSVDDTFDEANSIVGLSFNLLLQSTLVRA